MMKQYILSIKLCLYGLCLGVLCPSLLAQTTTGKIVLEKATPATAVVVTATQQVILKPGFHAKADASSNFNAKIGTSNNLSPIMQVASGSTITVPTSPSTSQNYIQTKTFLTATTDESSTDVLTSIQYFDGLGRPTQTITAGITPSGADLVSRVSYDDFGRQNITYLPVAVGGNFGLYTDDSSIGSATSTLYGSNNRPYAETLLEASPLDRVIGQKKPGADWESHPSNVSYDANAADIYCFSMSNNTLQKGTNYAANTLYKTQTTDEDGKQAVEYKDKLGHVVVKQSSTDVFTYYVYNDLEQLAYVLPPTFIEKMGSATSFDDANTLLKQFAYVYRYDERGNCNYKKLPGCDPINMVYDKADRLVLGQDGNQRVKSPVQWSITKYDIFGRVLYTGVINREIGSDEKKIVHDNVIVEAKGTTNQLSNTGYTCNTFVGEVVPLTVSYYDDYTFLPDNDQLKYDNTQEQNGYTALWANATGLLTGTRTYLLDGSGNYNTTAMYYDDDAKVVQTRSTNHLGGYDLVNNQYDFTGKVLKTLKKHKISTSNEVSELYTYSYDNGQRLTSTTYSLNGANPVTLTSNTYDELGRLKEKKRHGGKEAGAYEYNIQNWPTKIISGTFLEQLYYNSLPSGATVASCYNGNIAYSVFGSTNSMPLRSYAYTYDDLNRLKIASGYYFTYSQSSPAGNDEIFDFDKMGNITSLERYSDNFMVDKLLFKYSGNQVTSIYDPPGSRASYSVKEYQDKNHVYDAPNEMTYDNNGNMTKDLDRDIVTIRYNVLNLPDLIQFKNGNQIKNLYDAGGHKLGTEYFTQLTNITPLADGQIVNQSYMAGAVDQNGTAYIGNFEYNTLKGNNSLTALSRIYNDEGYVENLSNPQYYYFRHDHLGNNREVWLANTNTIAQRTQYYPSGLPWAYQDGDKPDKQNKKYNGKEFVEMHGFDTYDYGARGMYAATGRWTSVDALCEKHYNISPYAVCGNNTVNRIDPDGKDYFITIQRNDKNEIIGITFNATVYITGDKASPDMAVELNATAAKTFTTKEMNGVKVGMNVKYEYRRQISLADANKEPGGNLLVFTDSPTPDPKSGRVDSYVDNDDIENATPYHGEIYTKKLPGEIKYDVMHETMHMFGFDERYKGTTPDRGYKNDIMGGAGNFNIARSHYQSIYDHTMKTQQVRMDSYNPLIYGRFLSPKNYTNSIVDKNSNDINSMIDKQQ